MTDAAAALERLRQGNRRFVEGGVEAPRRGAERRQALAAGQAPFAAVLGCADSRVPPELIFDEGLGDLFVVRVAGNVAAPAELGSLEFAVEELGVPLVVVLGHARCGAVRAALEAGDAGGGDAPSAALQAVMDAVQPAVAAQQGSTLGLDDRAARAEDANIRHSVEQIRRSALIAAAERERGVRVVGAKYGLADGAVTFLDAPHG